MLSVATLSLLCFGCRVARSSSKLHSNLDDDEVASLHGQVRQLINVR